MENIFLILHSTGNAEEQKITVFYDFLKSTLKAKM